MTQRGTKIGEYCEDCGMKLTQTLIPQYGFSKSTGEETFKKRFKCPNFKWYRPFHQDAITYNIYNKEGYELYD